MMLSGSSFYLARSALSQNAKNSLKAAPQLTNLMVRTFYYPDQHHHHMQ